MTYSSARLTRISTRLVIQCQDERSQLKNTAKAMTLLRSRLCEIELQKHNDVIASQRKTMAVSGDRSDKIRTYIYSQSRVVDHRIGPTMCNLPAVTNLVRDAFHRIGNGCACVCE